MEARIREMILSGDEHLQNLGRILFWESNPTYWDFIYMEGHYRLYKWEFEKLKKGEYESTTITKETAPFNITVIKENIIKVRDIKHIMIKSQNFQQAAAMRDEEIRLREILSLHESYC